MKPFPSTRQKKLRAFSLVEAALSVGILSFGFLSVVPLLGLGLTSSRHARDNCIAAQLAETMMQEAQQGTLTAGTSYFDNQENACPSRAGASFQVQTAMAPVTTTPAAGDLTRVTVQVTPLSTPGRSQVYALVFFPQ